MNPSYINISAEYQQKSYSVLNWNLKCAIKFALQKNYLPICFFKQKLMIWNLKPFFYLYYLPYFRVTF